MGPWSVLWFILVVVLIGLGLFIWWRRSSVYGQGSQAQQVTTVTKVQSSDGDTAPVYPPPPAVESPREIPTATADYPVFPGIERHIRKREEIEQLREERLLEREQRHHIVTSPVHVYASPQPQPQVIPTATVVSDIPEAKPVPPSNAEGAVSYSP
jgi:hypothetical protein